MGLSSDTLRDNIIGKINGQVLTVKTPDGNSTSVTVNVDDPNQPGTRKLIEAIAQAVVEHILASLDIEVPSSSFIVSVAGQATGTPNPSKVKCTVS